MDTPLSPASDPRLGRTPCFEPEPDLAGTILGERYKVRRLVACGGMASVYLGKDEPFRCHVALKVLRRPDPEARRRFAIEGEVLSNVHSPHLVRAFGSGTTPDKRPYLVLEHLPGETLAARFARRGPLPWREVAQIGTQLASALDALHAAGVIHRDVKPYNAIAVTRRKGQLDVKLIDLGLARVSDGFQQAQDEQFTPVLPRHRTDLGRVLGTPEYLPPEAGAREADAGFDIYALATMLYQLCTGAFPRRTGMQPLHLARPECDAPAELSRLLLAALAPDPTERLPSAERFSRGLEAILAAHPEVRAPEHLLGGCYDRLEVLGVGRSAAVYRASDRWLSREVALKVLRREHPRADDKLRFRLAAKILSALDHPNIVDILHAGIAGGQMFVATELCPGATASEFVSPASRLRPDEVIAIGKQLTSALTAIHAIGVLYRDLHPGNVLIARGAEPKASLFDFDAAQVSPEFYAHLDERYATPPEQRQEPAQDIDLRRADYVAPEVRAGGPYTAACDVFALGLLLYRLLTGARPFRPEGGEPTPAREHCTCPDALDTLLGKMLSPVPQARPVLAQVMADLEDARIELAGEPEPPRPSPAQGTASHVDIAANVAEPELAAAPAPAPAAEPVPTAEPVPRAPTRSSLALPTLVAACLVVGWVFGTVVFPGREHPAEREDAALAAPARNDEPRAVPEPENGENELCAFPEPEPTAAPPASPDVDAALEPPRPRRTAPRAPARTSARSEPISSAEAETAASRVIATLRACPEVPGVVVADLELSRGRGTVTALNRHAVSPALPWHACAKAALESVAYPAIEAVSRVRVRLQLR